MVARTSAAMVKALASVAPGQPLREGLDRVLQANRGALIVVGDTPAVLAISSGGFHLDTEFSPQRLSELAKMDGAIILDGDASRIAWCNVHLVPDPAVPTTETGTRHRTAERVARSIDVPVISVSEDLSMIAVYRHGGRHRLQATPVLVNRANQALQTLERYQNRLEIVGASLTALEVEDLVTVRDVAAVLQRAEMVRRISEEIEGYLVELGDDGRLLLLQRNELVGGVDDDRRLVVKDYVATRSGWGHEQALAQLASLSTEDLLVVERVAGVLRLPPAAHHLDAALQPRGLRLLSKIPRLPAGLVERLVAHFGSLPKVMRATYGDLAEVAGVGEARARVVKDGLSRLAETSILDRYS